MDRITKILGPQEHWCAYTIGLIGKDCEFSTRAFLREITILEYLVVVVPRWPGNCTKTRQCWSIPVIIDDNRDIVVQMRKLVESQNHLLWERHDVSCTGYTDNAFIKHSPLFFQCHALSRRKYNRFIGGKNIVLFNSFSISLNPPTNFRGRLPRPFELCSQDFYATVTLFSTPCC